MKVSTAQPLQLIYSLFQHEYLGYLFESFVIQLDDKGRLTLQHQNISSKNAKEFGADLDERDYELIKLMDQMQQESIVLKFYKKKIKPAEFFLKFYDKEKGDQELQNTIDNYLEVRRSRILDLLHGKMIFEMGRDGEPAWRQIHLMEKKASVLFHFRRNEDNTHYFPTIKHEGEKLEWQYNSSFLICNQPAWLVVNDKLFSFEKGVDGPKLKPFLNKKFVVVPRKMEPMYYEKFVSPLVAAFDVYAKGFEINTERYPLITELNFSELATAGSATPSLFEASSKSGQVDDGLSKLFFKVSFKYGNYTFPFDPNASSSVKLEQKDEEYVFHKVKRDISAEQLIVKKLIDKGLLLKNGRFTIGRAEGFHWLAEKKNFIEDESILVRQSEKDSKRYFLGEAHIDIQVNESIDWFDIHAVIKFGEYEISFEQLRKLISGKKREVKLPNGEIAVIPEAWFANYADLFAFMETGSGNRIKKHHIALIQDLQNGQLAQVSMDRKLQKLQDFEKIEDHPISPRFKGELRPYQKAGYNWMKFLTQYNFGGCLADDMGLGKTVQTLAMLQSEMDKGVKNATLLIMPTSLIYNWELEAKKFTPDLKVLVYTGSTRDKDVSTFEGYDLVLTSYGITRLDIDLLKQYYFHYVILDESQAIKNPQSNIAKSVRKLKSKYRLILTGTPLENSTLDLWSQMSFANPGILGTENYFREEFLLPIEKKQDVDKSRKLNVIIKPFILRRQKSQVAKDLPEKVENVQYSTMTAQQEEKYEEVKSYYRNKILDNIEKSGVKKSQLLLLQGLTQLRQIANHPKMTDPEYTGDSGKLEDVIYMIENALSEGHKILIFSQFVKHLTIVREYFDKQEWKYAYLDGSTKNRQEQVENFQNNEDIRLFLISLKAGGLGLNLTRADYVFLLDPWWNPAIEAQAVDRAHRIGQKNKVFTYKFITRNTVEEKILALQQNKIKLASDLITTEESFIKKLEASDIASLLS
jgi:superfamily II DNA or RNA helicase